MTQDNPTNIKYQQNDFDGFLHTRTIIFIFTLKNTLKWLEHRGNSKAEQCDFIHNTNSICGKEA